MNGDAEHKKLRSTVDPNVHAGNEEVSGLYDATTLLNDADAALPGFDDVYGDIMRKEERVLDTVDRVVNHARLSETQQRSFMRQPLHVVLTRIIETVKLIMEDIMSMCAESSRKKDSGGSVWSNLAAIVMKEDRKIYIGILLIALSIVATLASGDVF
jgi:hypothetical protein